MVGIGDGELILRLALAVVLCAAIGLERESRDQVAGLRTHSLVGLGAALFTLVSAYGYADFAHAGSAYARLDPMRIAAQIVPGIGFLGAGAIIRQGLSVRGVTTASSLWIAAAIGLAAGAGYYAGAIVVTGLVLFVLIVLVRLRPAMSRFVRSDFVLLNVELHPGAHNGPVLGLLCEHHIHVDGMTSDISQEREQIELELRVPPQLQFGPVLEQLSELDAVAGVSAVGMRVAPGAAPRGTDE